MWLVGIACLEENGRGRSVMCCVRREPRQCKRSVTQSLRIKIHTRARPRRTCEPQRTSIALHSQAWVRLRINILNLTYTVTDPQQ